VHILIKFNLQNLFKISDTL